MKKLIFLLFPLFASGQIERYVAFNSSVDVRNAVVGSAPTNFNPELDINFATEIHFGKGITFGIHYETFKAIGYYKASWGAGYVFEPLKRLRAHIDLQTELIFRQGNVTDELFKHQHKYIGVSINGKLVYELFPKTLPNVYFGFKGSPQLRGDKKSAGYKDYLVFNGHFVVEYVVNID